MKVLKNIKQGKLNLSEWTSKDRIAKMTCASNGEIGGYPVTPEHLDYICHLLMKSRNESD